MAKAVPTIGATIPPPTLCEIFQKAPTRPRSLRGNQLAIVINEGPTPIPWNKPLNTTSVANIQNPVLKPNPTFTMAHKTRPHAIKTLGLALSARLLIIPLLIP
ncbi:hypothetical protein D3C73_1139980 [compost metagenome]